MIKGTLDVWIALSSQAAILRGHSAPFLCRIVPWLINSSSIAEVVLIEASSIVASIIIETLRISHARGELASVLSSNHLLWLSLFIIGLYQIGVVTIVIIIKALSSIWATIFANVISQAFKSTAKLGRCGLLDTLRLLIPEIVSCSLITLWSSAWGSIPAVWPAFLVFGAINIITPVYSVFVFEALSHICIVLWNYYLSRDIAIGFKSITSSNRLVC